MSISKNAGNSTEAQRARILAWLKKRPLDTVEAYTVLGALHAPRRLMELRRAGHPIKMRWVHRYGPDGARHRVGEYFMDEPTPSPQTELFGALDSPFTPNSPHKAAHVL
ncbi:helix-turn-helix domain-containing protein [Paraburkholderia terrae]|uniref:helix-turn-helix domain-containing protein n=1 Tax=Paraburkholderia terrae TaxID=311230 RepID=UPI0020657BA5|nr:helix-turn-helix domain-containing protein [Paraburkholderia terrae]BDC38935.1 hypothetical protein PTKU15_22320 [Paraburkholderia terrae]